MIYLIRLDEKESLLNYRVKDKKQIIDIWLELSQMLLTNRYETTELKSISQTDKEQVILMKKNNYWRLYIIDSNISSHKKIVIISFPFSIDVHDYGGTIETIRLTYQGENIGYQEISMIKSTMKYMFGDRPIPIYDAIISTLEDIEDTQDFEEFLSNVIVGLLSFSDGYIRYDYDPENHNSDIHPLYHLDIFFNKESTFKVGLPNKYDVDDLIALLDKDAPCKYLR